MRRRIVARSVAIAALLGAASVATSAQAQVGWDRLLDPEPENWLLYGGNLGGWRYSELDQINADNAGDVNIRYLFAIGGRAAGNLGGCREESVILSDNGQLFVADCHARISSWDIDVDGGAGATDRTIAGTEAAIPLWFWNSEETKSRTQRGPALFNDSVYIGTNDTRIIRLNRASGEVVYDLQVMAPTIPEFGTPSPDSQGFTTEPLPVRSAGGREMLVQGESTGGQSGTISWIGAFDAETGETIWREYMVPFPGEPGHETWQDDWGAWKTGGGGVWSHGTFDPATNLIFHGTGDAMPTYDPAFRPGDNLFTSSTVALDADTGDKTWYFQIVPNESWDYDQPGTRMLIDAADGTPAVGVFARSGHFYTHNRADGTILGVFAHTPVNWTAGIDEKTGRPIDYVVGGENGTGIQRYAGVSLVRGATVGEVCPNWSQGAVGLNPSAFDPESRLAYLMFTEGCVGASTLSGFPSIDDARAAQGVNRVSEGAGTSVQRQPPSSPNLYTVAAWNVDTGERVAEFTNASPAGNAESGMLVTAGGIAVTSDPDGNIYIFDSSDLSLLRTINIGMELSAPASTWMIDGKQYIGVVGGSNGGNGFQYSATAVVIGLD